MGYTMGYMVSALAEQWAIGYTMGYMVSALAEQWDIWF
jgi:hypothetical protein